MENIDLEKERKRIEQEANKKLDKLIEVQCKKLAKIAAFSGELKEGRMDWEGGLKSYRKAAVLQPDNPDYQQKVIQLSNMLQSLITR